MTEPKPARRMSEKTREDLGEKLVSARRSVRELSVAIYDCVSLADEAELASDLAESARDLARIARRLAKAGGQ